MKSKNRTKMCMPASLCRVLLTLILLVSGSGYAETVLFDLCGSLHTDGNWNVVNYYSTGMHIPMAIDDAGRLTSVSFRCTDAFASFSTAGDIPTVYPVNAGRDSFTLTTSNNTAQIIIGGLTASQSYDLKFFGSRYASGPREIDITIGGTTKTLETAYNKDQTVGFSGIVCSGSGEIVIDLLLAASSSYTYLGVIEINGTFEDAQTPAVYVSPNGNDSNPGTLAQPVATFSGAAARVREYIASGVLPPTGIEVLFRAGIYSFSSGYDFNAADSGVPGRYITYKPYQDEYVRLTGAEVLDTSQLSLVKSSDSVWSRLRDEAKGNVMKMSLLACGINNYGTPKDYPVEIIFNEELMEIARWPNDSYDLTDAPTNNTSFTYSGTRPENWLTAPDAYTSGHYSNGYFRSIAAVDSIDTNAGTITLAENPLERGVGEDKAWYVFNLIEELDTPGEYYIDKTNNMLYFWPPADTTGAELLITKLGDGDQRLFNINGASYLRFENLVFEGCRTRITRLSCDNVIFDGCVFRNSAGPGITGTATNTVIKNCEFYDLGKGGIGVFNCGDRKTLTPANLLITNNYITKLGRFKDGIEYTAGISMHTSCCGVTVSHNHIENTPDIGISPGGNNHVIEYNRLRRVSRDSYDMGATYTPGDWSSPYGSIFRYNEVYDNTSSLPGTYSTMDVRGIYFDFWASGATVEGNILHTIGGRAFHTAGGHSNQFRNNVIVNALYAHYSYYFSSIDCADLLSPILEMDYNVPGSAWYEAFPFLTNIPDDCADPDFDLYRPPHNCIVEKTIAYNCPTFTAGTSFDRGYFPVASGNLTNTDPLFIDEAGLVFALRDNSPAYNIPGFERIAWEKIGLLDTKYASRPIPLSGADKQTTPINLYWAPALDVGSHKVYLGTDIYAVTNRMNSTLLSHTVETSVTQVTLDSGRMYYWAVDEYDADGELMGEGPLWTFTTSGYNFAAADFNADYSVDYLDLEEMAAHWLSACSTPSFCGETDLNNDGTVDKLDFAQFALAVQQDDNDYIIDFEAPDYSVGILDGQNGWTGNDFYVSQTDSSGLYQGGQTAGVSAHNVWANLVGGGYKIPLDLSQGHIHIAIDLLVCEASGFHLGLRVGSPDYGPQFGYDTVNGETKFILREVAMGASYYGNLLEGRDGHWIRLILVYDTDTGLADMSAYDLTVDENIDTGIAGFNIGLWTATEAGMFFRHLHRDQSKPAEVKFDNINVFIK